MVKKSSKPIHRYSFEPCEFVAIHRNKQSKDVDADNRNCKLLLPLKYICPRNEREQLVSGDVINLYDPDISASSKVKIPVSEQKEENNNELDVIVENKRKRKRKLSDSDEDPHNGNSNTGQPSNKRRKRGG